MAKTVMTSLETYCAEQLQHKQLSHTRRTLRHEPQNLVSFASNDYLGLSTHPQVVAALQQPRAGAGASRLVAGNHANYAPLESALATLKGQQAALVFGSGYLANLGTITALMGKGDLILADKLAHACILDCAQLSGATLKRFKHNDVAHAESLLNEHRSHHKNTLIVTEHIFSMDGDRAPLQALHALAKQHHAWLMVDDAHGLFEPPPITPDIWMGTLSKAAGTYGGYIAASRTVVDYLLTSARSFIYSTGLPPSVCAASLEALTIAANEPERRARPLELARRFSAAMGLPEAQSAIVPLIVGDSETALELSDKLSAAGMYVVAIRPPTVPPNTARLRISFSAAHTDAEVDRLIAALREVMPCKP